MTVLGAVEVVGKLKIMEIGNSGNIHLDDGGLQGEVQNYQLLFVEYAEEWQI